MSAGYFSVEEFCKPFLLAREKGKSIVAWTISMSGKQELPIERLELNSIPVYSSAARAIKALSAVYRYKVMREASL